MKILPITNVSANSVKHNENAKKMTALPKSVDAKQNMANPTFKNCGATMLGSLAACSLTGIT